MSFKHKPLFGKDNYSYKHGMTKTPTWNSWISMHSRCKGQGNSSHLYKNVKICKRWDKFENFYKDMGERPKGKTLDRIDSKGNYEPSNCRWATAKEQANNTDRPRQREDYKNSKTFNGKSLRLWAKELGLSYQTVVYRIKVGIPLKKTKRKYTRRQDDE